MANSSIPKSFAVIVPTLSAGGMEKVVAEMANYFSQKEFVTIHLILLVKKPRHFSISSKVIIHEPNVYNETNFIKVLIYLKKKIKLINPHYILSFGSKYNSFVMIGCLGLERKYRIYLSDRSNPYRNTILTLKKGGIERHDGIIHFILKRILYKRAYGILCQTQLSLKIEEKFLGHKRLIYFPNPIKVNDNYLTSSSRENIILNVGRFIETKQQSILVEIFQRINDKNWKLIFLGDGPRINYVRNLVDSEFIDNIIFEGNVKNVQSYMNKSKIFAFTSASEGFPNSLAEALSTPIASIAFDCPAGPSDLIINDLNGYLIENNKIDEYQFFLNELMKQKDIRIKFEQNAIREIKKFDSIQVLENLFLEITK